jgi:P4 family phage/plasmid primase-like protien
VLTDKAPEPLPLAMTPPAGAGAVALQGVEMTMLQAGTQDSVAMIFARQMVGKMLYNHTRGKWLEWDGARWRIEATKKALNFARDLARSVNYEGSRSIGSASFCAGVEMLALADPALSAVGDEFDRDNYLLNTPGGTFDLRTNEGRQHNPDDRLSLCTAVAPTREGGAAFDKFLDEITLGDRALAEFLQVSLGACLSGAVESHWLLFWTGTGRNGKNTLGELVQDAMGDYARKVPTSVLMAKKHEGHPTEMANLQGIRLALSSEINDGEHWHEARLNEVTGDGTLSGRFMGRDFFEFKRTHKHLIYGNHRPQLRAVTPALRSRIKIVPFRADFNGREDADLPQRLRENLGYVLAWLMEGHGKWLAAGKRLPSCRTVDAEIDDYFAAQSTPEMWLAERVQVLPTDGRPASHCPKSSDLYRDYSEWKKDRGEQPVSMARWAEAMKKFHKEVSAGVRYRGLMLIPQGGNVPFPLVA